MTRTVFVTQGSAKFDLSALDEFGTKQLMFTRSIFPDEIEDVMGALVDRARRILKNGRFNPEEDYIALSGDPLLIAISVTVAVESASGAPITLLKFDKMAKTYYPAILNMGGVKQGIPALNSLGVEQ